ncbi:MAG: GntR family transcriptional regulator [Firmicutes bacterium]|nr:GntR family transcriptional regulator [Bacillota bacterium]
MQRTIAAQIYETLKTELVSGHHLPGTRWLEDALAQRFAVSITPVREAIRLLESEGLVIRQAHRAIFVRTFSLQEARQVYELREVLEPQAIRWAARHRTTDWLLPLQTALREQREALESGDLHRLQWLNYRFHVILAEAGGNPWLTETVERLWSMVPLLRAAAWQIDQSRPANVIAEHEAILRCLPEDYEEAAALAQSHVRQGWERVREALAQVLPQPSRTLL